MLLQQVKQAFEKCRNSIDPAVSGVVKDMVLYNLVWASLLTGDTKAALGLYTRQTYCRRAKRDELKTMAEYEQFRSRIRQAIGK